MKQTTMHKNKSKKRHNRIMKFSRENIGRLPHKPMPQAENQQQRIQFAKPSRVLSQRIFLSELLSLMP